MLNYAKRRFSGSFRVVRVCLKEGVNCVPEDFMLLFSSAGYNIDEKKVKGGEACLWSEYIDNENLIQTTWSVRAPEHAYTHSHTPVSYTHLTLPTKLSV